MTPVLDTHAAHLQAQGAIAALRDAYHAKTDTYAAVVAWISALVAAQQAYMTSCGRDKLADAQVRLKQLIALRSALVDPGGATTGHQFD